MDTEEAVYYHTSVWWSTGWGSSVLGCADAPTGVLELSANFTDRGFPERQTHLHGESVSGGRSHSAVRTELLGGGETLRLPGHARMVGG
ncbi:unnamed protein product [Protopolystoma xenopodis]|uniref:Uncharacterized protein n=1 Tax=Protopolystoma xenopodis TaxID=117903 RepID=A0A448WUM7_9PLAT|nr:unnamed protein product [Protopolystoma xenopodis]